MTTLIERMRQELVRRNYAATTTLSYLKAVEHFQQHISMPLEAIGPDDIRSYHAYLLGERKLAVNTAISKQQRTRWSESASQILHNANAPRRKREPE